MEKSDLEKLNFLPTEGPFTIDKEVHEAVSLVYKDTPLHPLGGNLGN